MCANQAHASHSGSEQLLSSQEEHDDDEQHEEQLHDDDPNKFKLNRLPISHQSKIPSQNVVLPVPKNNANNANIPTTSTIISATEGKTAR